MWHYGLRVSMETEKGCANYLSTTDQPGKVISAKDQIKYTLVHQFVITVHPTQCVGGDYNSFVVHMIYILIIIYTSLYPKAPPCKKLKNISKIRLK